ncbi:MAG: hypothetical protein ACJA1C_000574 [Crocinitomicaceae bacterium]|jgi:hypothetical protein
MCSAQFSFGQLARVKIRVLPVQFIKTEKDKDLKSKESAFHFKFSRMEQTNVETKITYKMDGKIRPEELMSGDTTLEIKTKPGEHTFEFFIDSNWYKITTQKLEVEKQFRSYYSIRFDRVPNPSDTIPIDEVCKPVIYLYPEKEMAVEVKIDFDGENPILYPAYNDSWKCTASPNGDLKIGESTYNYLFWEVGQPNHLSTADLNEGFIVRGENSISFLEAKLNAAGFTPKEKADFITFWGPRIQQNELNFVRFEFNEVCDKFATLSVSPTPDNVYRLYIFFSPIEEVFEVVEQQIPKMNRNGFTVLEWGGQVSLSIAIKPTNI